MTTRNAVAVHTVQMLALVACLGHASSGRAASRTFEFTTTEVSQPGITVTADGRSIVFNLVGHLFLLPVTGGAARQITFGPYYDSEPVLSPDGTRVAFVSNRDGSDANIFVMDVTGGKIVQATREFQTGRPAWSPDGKTIAYISYLRREEYQSGNAPGFGGGGGSGILSTIPLAGGTPQRHGAPRTYGSIFYLADGRLAWLVASQAAGGRGRGAAGTGGGGRLNQPGVQPGTAATRIEVLAPDGTAARFGAVPAQVGQALVTSKRDGLFFVSGGRLMQYTFGAAEATVLAPFAGGGVRIDIAPDGRTVYAASDARLWRVTLPDGAREEIKWSARVKMETLTPAVLKWTPSSGPSGGAQAILTPRISPDGRTLVFMAAGSLWEQPLAGSAQARKLVDETAYQLEPAFSPDGKQLAFVSDKWGRRELRVLDVTTRETRTLTTVGGASWVLFPSWSADGTSIVVQRSDQIGAPYRLLRVDGRTGTLVELTRTSGNWTARPHVSADGGALYYTSRAGGMANLYRLALQDGAKPEAVTDLTRHVHDGVLSPDGKWVAFRRNTAIMIAPIGTAVLKDQDFRLFSARGGRSFAFTPDSSAIVYAEGSRVWRQPLQGAAAEIPIRLTLPRVTAAPLLISRVRVLDLKAGRFGDETSMLIEQGRIRWIGAERGRTIPASVVRLDGGGRFVIPGIMDSHTHAAWSNQQITEDSLIAYGVTSVRDTGSRLDIVNALRDRGDTTNLPVPRYFASGDIFEGLMPLWGDAFLEITTREEAREHVRMWKDLGASFIKVYASLPWFLKSEAAAEANRLGLPVAGHGLSVEEIVRSVNFGVTSLEHNGGNTNDDIVKLLAASGTRLDPTLTVFGQGTPSMLADPKNLDEKFRTFIPEDAIKAANPGRPVTDEQRAQWIENTLGPIKAKHDAGVKLLDGTDALMTSVFHGPSVQWSLQFFAWARIPAIDVLRIATIEAAEVVGASADLGSIEPGKVGDVVILDADPLQDVRNTMAIWRVVKGGHVFDPATMRK